jgi:hypothetical protein
LGQSFIKRQSSSAQKKLRQAQRQFFPIDDFAGRASSVQEAIRSATFPVAISHLITATSQ